jgi:hypothetical protein
VRLGVLFVGSLYFFMVASALAVAGAPTTEKKGNGFATLGQRALVAFDTPEHEISRCMISPVLATDGMTVAISVDHVFSADDVIVSISDVKIDIHRKHPVLAVLMTHQADELLPVGIRRGGKETIVLAKCSDSKPYSDLLLAASLAASKEDAPTCAEKLLLARQLHAPSYPFKKLGFECSDAAGRITNPSNLAREFYELYRQLVLENAWSRDALSSVRGSILQAVETLQKNNQLVLAQDLKKQYDDAVSLPIPSASR